MVLCKIICVLVLYHILLVRWNIFQKCKCYFRTYRIFLQLTAIFKLFFNLSSGRLEVGCRKKKTGKWAFFLFFLSWVNWKQNSMITGRVQDEKDQLINRYLYPNDYIMSHGFCGNTAKSWFVSLTYQIYFKSIASQLVVSNIGDPHNV